MRQVCDKGHVATQQCRGMEMKKTKTDVTELQTRLKRNQRLLYSAYIKIEELVTETQEARDWLAGRRLLRRQQW